MSLKYRTNGFVFRKIDRNESDKIFSVFTKDFGRLEITAKAIRKITSKLGADIDMFYLSEIEFIQGKNSKTLTDAVKIKKFDSIYKDFRKLEVAYQVANILDIFIKGQEKDEETFDLLGDFLNNISLSSLKIKNYQLIFQYFFWNFLSVQGFKPEVYNCAACQEKINPYNIYFSNKEGGIICRRCITSDKDAKKINSDIVKILRLIFNKDWHAVSRLRVDLHSQSLLEDISENSLRAFCPAHC